MLKSSSVTRVGHQPQMPKWRGSQHGPLPPGAWQAQPCTQCSGGGQGVKLQTPQEALLLEAQPCTWGLVRGENGALGVASREPVLLSVFWQQQHKPILLQEQLQQKQLL